MSKDLNIVVIEGTTRVQRESIKVAKFIAKIGEEIEGVKITLVDPTKLTLPGDGNDPEGKDPKYTKMTERADAFFVVVPEYNHSFPGSLKRVLDSELQNYIHKPVAFAGVSSGRWGGVRAIESLVSSVREMGLVATFSDSNFPNVQDIFEKSGKPKNDIYYDIVKRSYDELIWMAHTLKHGRDNL